MPKTKNKHEERFYRCPGAWIGNMPGQMFDGRYYGNPNIGHIIVNPAKAVWAIRFLRRFYLLTGSAIHDEGCGGSLGLRINLETNPRERIAIPALAPANEQVAA